MLTAFEQQGDVLKIRSSNFAISNDGELPRPFDCIPPRGVKLGFQLRPVLEEVAAVLNLSEERLPMLCGGNVVPVSNEQIGSVAVVLSVANERDGYGLFFTAQHSC